MSLKCSLNFSLLSLIGFAHPKRNIVQISIMLVKLRQQIRPLCTHSIVCGNKDARRFPFLPQIILRTYWDIQYWLLTTPKLAATFPGAQTQANTEGHSFTHPVCVHTYALITIMNEVPRQSVIGNKMNLWTEHVFGWDRSTKLLSQAAAGSVGDR